MANDIADLQSQIEDIQKRASFLAEMISSNYKEYMASEKSMLTEIAALKKQVSDPSKSPEKEIEALKARVKDLEGKLAKMGKK